MQTLRYPIVMFVITALAVIGIGVGIVAATTNQSVYGPSWGRFTASFPGHVYRYRGHTTIATHYGDGSCPTGSKCVSSAFGSTVTLTFPFEYSTASTPAILCASGIACHPNELVASVLKAIPAQPTEVVQKWVAILTKSFRGPSTIVYRGNANGLAVAIIVPRFPEERCRGAEVVSNGRVLWYLLAFSNGLVGTVENFLASFQPIG